MRVVTLPNGLPRVQGQAHGEAFRPLIAEVAAIRLELARAIGGFASDREVLGLARAHLPILARYAPELHAELLGIAEGSGLSPEAIVVLNHYTDLRDLSPGVGPEDGCSVVWARTPEGTVLGQTWDMHGSAAPYVGMLRVPPRGARPGAWLFTITGCLGMTGLNDEGVGITINNLRSTDARVGLVWPALVRRVLWERTLEVARDEILRAPLGSGHHYLVAAGDQVCGIETSGVRRTMVFRGERPAYVHTNHCLDAEVGDVTRTVPHSTTRERMHLLEAGLRARPLAGAQDLWRHLGSHEAYPRSVCTHLSSPTEPHAMRTCGAVVMDLDRRMLWAADGCVHRCLPHRFDPRADEGG